jgi:Tfp pilus assembly protein PilN
MVGLLGAYWLDDKRVKSAQAANDQANADLARAGQQLASFERMEKQKRRMLHKADVTASLLERRPRHYIVAEITNALPKGAALSSIELLTQEDKQSNATKSVVKSRRSSRARKAVDKSQDQGPIKLIESVRVMGLASNDKIVSRFIKRLNDSDLFDEVNLAFSNEYEYEKDVVRQFLLLVEIDERVQVTPEMAKKQKLKRDAME